MGQVAVLDSSHSEELQRFLSLHANCSMLLRADLHQATFVAAREGGAIVAVAAHCGNGVVFVEGSIDAIGAVVRTAADCTGREVAGLSGPYEQVVAAREALDMLARKAKLDSREALFTLALEDLRVPAHLAHGRWQCRHPTEDDIPELARWGVAYDIDCWVLIARGQPVAMSTFEARLSDTVQVGGAFTPPPLRCRGYGRAVVAGSLLEARSRGVARSILFANVDNDAARAACLSLGYRIAGDHGLVLFDT
jgi:uncharacterized protein